MLKIKRNVKVVPWFSMSEWKTVYALVYSDNPEEQQRGLERLVGWKARCPSLPAAVECTLGIQQVLLLDPEHSSESHVSVLREQQLRLMYSTTVMRFLNLMLDVHSEEDVGGTMYSKAEKQSIPEWIVNLRHDAAHGISLPDLSLLRAAAVFIRKWLHENYWEREAEVITDWHLSKEDLIASSADEEELKSIMETWEALSLYELTGFDNMRQIPDNDLRKTVSSIHALLHDQEDENVSNDKHLSLTKVSSALSLVLRRLVRFFKDHPGSVDKVNLLVNILFESDLFLPTGELIEIMVPQGFESQETFLQLPPALSKCCEGLMSTLWELGAIPTLLTKLISVTSDVNETILRRNMAALWTQKLLISCLKVREARKIRSAIFDRLDCKDIFLHYKERFPNANRKAIITSVSFAAVESQCQEFSLGYTWKILQIPGTLSNFDLIKQSIWPLPAKFSVLFLPCLFELLSPTMSLEARRLLLELVKTYNEDQGNFTISSEHRVYSMEDLICEPSMLGNKGSLEKNLCHQYEYPKDEGRHSHWSLSQSHLEWGKCPLGVLPWQQKQNYLEKEEYENRQQQRTWPRLSLPSDWTCKVTDLQDLDSVSSNEDNSTLRGIKGGRIMKKTSRKIVIKKQEVFNRFLSNV